MSSEAQTSYHGIAARLDRIPITGMHRKVLWLLAGITRRLYNDRFIRGLYVECRLYDGSLCIGSLVYNRAGEEI